MNGTDDFIVRLEAYLDDFDGATPLPDHVRDTVHAELPGIRQVHPGAGPRRWLTMLSDSSARARWGLAAAAIVVSVVVGGAILANNQNRQGIIGAPSATPSPTVSPSPTPTPPPLGNLTQLAPCAISGGVECLKPGRYTLNEGGWPATVSFDVPDGWWNYHPGTEVDGVLVDSDAPDGSGWGILFVTVGDVSKDPCKPEAGTFAPTDVDSPEELAAAMATWPGFATTNPQPITIDGADGVRVNLTSTLADSACPGDQMAWKTAAGDLVDTYPSVGADGDEHPAGFWIVEVAGELLVIRTTDSPGTSRFELGQGIAKDPTRHAADQVEMQAIVDSIQLDVPTP